MKQCARALDVAQEARAEAFAFGRSFDEPRDVRQDQFVIGAEVRLECGKGIVCHLALGVGKLVQQTGLAHVRQADKADVGDKFQLQPERERLAGKPGLGLFWRRIAR